MTIEKADDATTRRRKVVEGLARDQFEGDLEKAEHELSKLEFLGDAIEGGNAENMVSNLYEQYLLKPNEESNGDKLG